jgi:hypothetical protein
MGLVWGCGYGTETETETDHEIGNKPSRAARARLFAVLAAVIPHVHHNCSALCKHTVSDSESNTWLKLSDLLLIRRMTLVSLALSYCEVNSSSRGSCVTITSNGNALCRSYSVRLKVVRVTLYKSRA